MELPMEVADQSATFWVEVAGEKPVLLPYATEADAHRAERLLTAAGVRTRMHNAHTRRRRAYPIACLADFLSCA